MHGMFRKVTLLEISRSLLVTGVAGLQYTVCNATRNSLLTKLLKGVLKHIKNFQEVVSYKVPYQKYTDRQTAATIPEITSTVEFLSSEAGANGFSAE